MDLLLLAMAGGLGTLCRYGMGELATKLWGEDFPWGTLTVNVLGSLAIGIAMHVALNSEAMSPRARLALVTGFCGAFTTFSTFSYETSRALSSGDYGTAALNVGLNLVLCLGATFGGFAIGRAAL